ncbi:N-alpha-acetyltransferase, non-catalitic subunit [Ophidiomyces ophidiicola]|nr:N-alpha-acetyltransferase, non-catalitic subunit [Ophidiomyces ophidiicola]
MDSKMDSGYLAPGEVLDDGYNVMRELLPAEIIGIMDQLLCFEVAWHMGHPLSQTLFTSFYIDHLLWPVPNALEDARFDRSQSQIDKVNQVSNSLGLVYIVLRAYCLALIKACDLVIKRVGLEYYYEEEDFVTQLYNRKLLKDVHPSRIHGLIDEAVSWLNAQDRFLDDAILEALRSRLTFRRQFLSTLELDISVIDSRVTDYPRACLDQIDIIEKSMSIGQPVDAAFSHKIQRRLASTVPPRPIVKINQADAISFLKRLFKDAIDVQGILDSGCPYDLMKSVWILQSRKPQPSVYIRSLTQSLLLNELRVLGSKSIKQFVYEDLTDHVLPWSMLLDKRNEAVEVPSDPRYQIVKQMNAFVERVAQPFIDTYRTSCLNRSRIRRTLSHSVVDWDHLQVEAEDLDVHLRSLTTEPAATLNGDEPTYAYPLSSWVYHQKLKQLRLLLQLGFELSVYSVEELPGLYWYLSHICATHLVHLDRIRSCVEIEYDRQKSQDTTKAPGNPERREAFRKTLKIIHRQSTELVATDAFAIALHALYTLILRYKLLPSAYLASNKHYASEKLRYELRMKPFFSVSLPEPVPFDSFLKESMLEERSDESVLDRAVAAIAEAKRSLEQCLSEGAFVGDQVIQKNDGKSGAKPPPLSCLLDDWTKDVKNSLRACIATSIAIGAFKKALTAASASQSKKQGPQRGVCVNSERKLPNLSIEIPEPGSKACWHDWWIVPKVSEAIPIRATKDKSVRTNSKK